MKKLVIGFISLSLIACAAPHAPAASPDRSLWTPPPEETTLEVYDYRERLGAPDLVIVDEREQLNNSRARIDQKFQDEQAQLDAAKTQKDRARLSKQFCAVDVYLDSHGDKHCKPYCHCVQER